MDDKLSYRIMHDHVTVKKKAEKRMKCINGKLKISDTVVHLLRSVHVPFLTSTLFTKESCSKRS